MVRAVSAAFAAAVAFVLGFAAWRYGWFFDTDGYRLEVILLGAAIAGWAIRLWKERTPAIGAAWLPLGVAACYGIAWLAGPASVKGTADSMLRWTAYAAWIGLLLAVWQRPPLRRWGEASIAAVGVFLAGGAWLGWFGAIGFPEIVLYSDDPELTATGARLAGFLQYPNAFGAVMAFYLVRQWQHWSGTSRVAGAFASASMVPFAGALVLTESRGALLALFAGFALALIWAKDGRERMRMALAASGSNLGAAGAAWGAYRSVGEAGAGAWWACLAMAVSAAALFFLRRWLDADDRRARPAGTATGGLRFPYSRQLAACGAALLVGFGLAAALGGWDAGGRVSGNYGTAASRLLFYRDAWTMFRDAPWVGYGGDSWRSLFGLYQRQPYVGGEVHSGYLEMLLDTGLLGFAAIAAMLALWAGKVARRVPSMLAPAAVLLLHAAIDFDFSFGFVWLLLLAWFALALAEVDVKPTPPAAAWSGAALFLAAAVWGIWAAWHGDVSARAARIADRLTEAPAAREVKLREALAASPGWTRVRLSLASRLPAQERAALLATGLRYEPRSGPLQLRLGLAEAEQGLVAQAEAHLREALRLERFSRDGHTAAITAMVQQGEALRRAGREEDAQAAYRGAASFYAQYRELVREVEAMRHPANGRRFGMTPAAEMGAARAYDALERREEAEAILRRLAESGDADWQAQARRLLAAWNQPGM